MIPKIIHYCWFGGGQKPPLIIKCIESWKKYCPDWEIREWNEDNFDVGCIPYIKGAYEDKKYAHVTDYARLKAVHEYGGIYLDTDVELIKPIDHLLSHGAFFAMQKVGEVATGLAFGAEAGETVLARLMKSYEEKSYSADTVLKETCVDIDKPVFSAMGLKNEDEIQRLGDVTVYTPEYFNPKDFETGKVHVTENTLAIHHYSRSWHDECERLIINTYRRFMNKYSREDAEKRFGRWYRRNRYRLVLKRYGLWGAVKRHIERVHAK